MGMFALIVVWWLLWTTQDGFLWLDERLAFYFTPRWSLAVAMSCILLVPVIVQLFLRLDPTAPTRPSDDELRGLPPDARGERILRFRRFGLKGLIIGGDGRASTSQFQATVWTITLAFGLILLLVVNRSPNCPIDTPPAGKCPPQGGISATIFSKILGEEQFPWEYLLLLGGPFAIAVSVRNNLLGGLKERTEAARVTKGGAAVQAGSPEALSDTMPDTLKVKTPPTETSAIGLRAGLRQLLSDDTGGGEVLDMQIIAFTFIGVAYFVLEVTTHPGNGLPKIPAALLVLMGISGAGYLSGKLINPMGVR